MIFTFISCSGGVVFGFPGLVLILRREGIYAEVCSCGVFCAGQQEQISILSTTGFAAAIGSRLFAGIFLDKLGPKLTGVCSGIVSTAGLILLASAKDVVVLTDRVTASWIILAVGGSSIMLQAFMLLIFKIIRQINGNRHSTFLLGLELDHWSFLYYRS